MRIDGVLRSRDNNNAQTEEYPATLTISREDDKTDVKITIQKRDGSADIVVSFGELYAVLNRMK